MAGDTGPRLSMNTSGKADIARHSRTDSTEGGSSERTVVMSNFLKYTHTKTDYSHSLKGFML